MRSAAELEEFIDNWEYWCPNKACRNRTFSIDTETKNRLLLEADEEGQQKYLTVRVLLCDRCKTPLVIGTHTFYNNELGWGAKGKVLSSSDRKMYAAVTMMSDAQLPYKPKEYIAFTEPVQERPLPNGLSKKVIASFREAEYAISKNKPIGAAAALRNTVRILVKDLKIMEPHFKDAIKKLPFRSEYRNALGNLKIVGDDTLHYEEYKISDLQSGLETLHLALEEHYENKDRLRRLHQAVSDKARKKSQSRKK